MSLDDACQAGKEMGLVGIDLLNPPDFDTVKKHGLVCSMVSFPTVDGIGGIGKADVADLGFLGEIEGAGGDGISRKGL